MGLVYYTFVRKVNILQTILLYIGMNTPKKTPVKRNRSVKSILLFWIWLCMIPAVYAQPGKTKPLPDSLDTDTNIRVMKEQERQLDSLMSAMQSQLQKAAGDEQKTRELEQKLKEALRKDSVRKAEQLERISQLRENTNGFPVAPFNDTLFYVYAKIGSFDAHERADAISKRIKQLYNDPFYEEDSLVMNETESGFDVTYKEEEVILTVTAVDALWVESTSKQLASAYLRKIKTEIAAEIEANSFNNWLKRIALVALIVCGLSLLVYLINRLFRRTIPLLYQKKDWYNNGLTIRKIKIMTPAQFRRMISRVKNVLRIAVILLAIYFTLPMLFSIFPETKAWTDTLLRWILTPARSLFFGIFHYLPNLFTILVIYFVFRYTIRGARYFVKEIEIGRIEIKGFHAEWAQPTFSIIRFLLYAFMVVLIFPYLPGSHSAAFQGVSVFLGVLLSLGSSSAISNMIAGLIITYMRPFKLGDRIKIGESIGDVIEKTMLVTRIRTIKNEEITVPNSTVLSSNTINYSTNTKPEDTGLILHTTVTIGYDVPWKEMHEVLIKAALQTEHILQKPAPFILQTSLEDFYVAYQLNAYTKEANKQANIYSQLHQNIQDCCNEAGIEIMSPHYRAVRDGNTVTIPGSYMGPDYQPPAFQVNVNAKKAPAKED